MLSDIAKGLLAGAAGTVALNVTTYADMAARGRASSNVPGEDVNELLHLVGIELSHEAHQRQAVAHGHPGLQEQRSPEGQQRSPEGQQREQGHANAREWPRNSTARNRLTGLGALTGYAVGLGVGVAYGIARPRLRTLPTPPACVLVGLAAMAGSDIPSVVLGVTKPKTWGLAGWIEDLIPHLIYGMTTVSVYENLHQAEQQAKRGWWPW